MREVTGPVYNVMGRHRIPREDARGQRLMDNFQGRLLFVVFVTQ